MTGAGGTVAVLRLLVRRFRVRILAWTVPITVLVAVTVPSYAGTYPDLASRGPLVAQLRSGGATEVMYGKLPLPGTLGQLAQWEVGAYVVLLVAVMALLLTTAMTRGDEDRGHTEWVDTAGVGRWASTCAAGLLCLIVFTVLGALVGAALALSGSPEITAAGAWTFGGAVAVTGIGVCATVLLIAEVCWDTTSTRTAAWGVLAVMFALRICADVSGTAWPRYLSWFGIKDEVAPFTHDRMIPLAEGLAVALALFGGAVFAHARRGFGAGLLLPPEPRARRLVVAGALGLRWRLGRVPLVLWAIPTVAVAALFGGMSRSLITVITNDASTSRLISSLGTAGDPVRQFFGFSYLFVVLVPLVYGVQTVLGGATDERRGLLDAELTVGTPRTAPLRSRLLIGAAGAVGLVCLAAGVQALLTTILVDGAAARWALLYPLAQLPGVLLAVGVVGLLVGSVPRLSTVIWAVVAGSGFAVMFGDLVHLPTAARRISLFGHGPEGAQGAITVLLVLAGLATVAGLIRMRHRDVQAG